MKPKIISCVLFKWNLRIALDKDMDIDTRKKTEIPMEILWNLKFHFQCYVTEWLSYLTIQVISSTKISIILLTFQNEFIKYNEMLKINV
jgi:hypothetical protein